MLIAQIIISDSIRLISDPSNKGDTVAYAIFIGVLSGVASWMFIQLTSAYFQKVVLPFYQKTVYRGVNLQGTWTGEQDRPGRGNFKFVFDLKQAGHRLSGTLQTIDTYPDNSHTNAILAVKGMISDGTVLLTYQGGAGRIGQGAMLLHVRDAGDRLVGAVMFLKAISGEVGVDVDLELNRKASS